MYKYCLCAKSYCISEPPPPPPLATRFIYRLEALLFEPVHEISNNVVCATSKASDQPAHMRSLIRAFSSRLIIL